LYLAASNGHAEVVRALLEWKGPHEEYVDPTAYPSYDAVIFAARNGHAEVVRALLEWKGPHEEYVDPTAYPSYDAVIFAARNGHGEVVQALLEWEGPDKSRVDISLARESAATTRILKICDEAERWSDMRAAWLAALVRGGTAFRTSKTSQPTRPTP
jgi:ankyrin repeat protein